VNMVGQIQRPEEPWELPPGWAWAEIDKVFDALHDGRTLHHGWSPQCESVASDNPNIWAVLRTTAIQPGKFLPAENKRLPKTLEPRANIEVGAGDLLLTCAGPRSRCGVACLVRETRPRLIISGKMYRFRTNPAVMDGAFLEAFLQTRKAWDAIDRMKPAEVTAASTLLTIDSES
jgi:type I restriction enzyme S subunit